MEFNGKIQLAGIDLDGTLLRDDKSVSQRSLTAIADAKARGIEVVPITGRPLKGVPDFIRENPAFDYIITSNGAQITRLQDDKALYSRVIPHEKCLQLIEAVKEKGFYYEVFADGVGYVDPVTMAFHRRRFAGTPLMPYIEQSRRVVEDVYDFFQNRSGGADELFIICQDRERRDAFRDEVAQDAALQHCELWDVFIELTEAGVNKGETLRELCRLLGIPIAHTIAFGDGENDLPFLQAAGVSVAMQNAVEQVRRQADYVTASNEEDGVAMVLEKL